MAMIPIVSENYPSFKKLFTEYPCPHCGEVPSVFSTSLKRREGRAATFYINIKCRTHHYEVDHTYTSEQAELTELEVKEALATVAASWKDYCDSERKKVEAEPTLADVLARIDDLTKAIDGLTSILVKDRVSVIMQRGKRHE